MVDNAITITVDHFGKIVGGGPGGVCAAVGAAKEGASVLLIERYGFLGGMATAGLVNPFMPYKIEGRRLTSAVFNELLDRLQETGQLDGLLESGARFVESVMVLSAHRQGDATEVATRGIGPALVFGRLWEQLRVPQVIENLLRGRRFKFPLERTLFLTVLHRLFRSGSDRSCLRIWLKNQHVPGTDEIALHHMYRAMAWLGEMLPEDQQRGATPFAPRCTKDVFEEALFARRRDLFSELDLVFFDTTSIYFEGQGGQELGEYGLSKDHRPDRRQMVVGMVLDGEGRPLCCELWPGNVTDVKTLVPIVDRLRTRFQIRSICIVADRGMISKETIAALVSKERKVHYILGARLRSVKEIREAVLSRGGRYHVVHEARRRRSDPSPLRKPLPHVRADHRRGPIPYTDADLPGAPLRNGRLVGGLQPDE